jgi:tetratricopeptide (TPR) repeat protein
MPSLAQLEKLLAADPRDTFVLYGLAQEHAKAGGEAGHAKAVEFYDRCLEVDPLYCYAYFHKARSLVALGRGAEAAKTLKAGIAAARKAGDRHAESELSGSLDELE